MRVCAERMAAPWALRVVRHQSSEAASSPLGERGRVLAPQAGHRFACLGEVYAHPVPEPALLHLHTLDPVEGDAKGL